MRNMCYFATISTLIISGLSNLSLNYKIESFCTNIRRSEITEKSLAFQYDSIKITSPYKFEGAKSQSTNAFVRIVYPVFDDTKLNEFVKKAILAPLQVKYKFENSFAAAHPALSDMDGINKEFPDYKDFASDFLTKFEIQASKEELEAYWYADINVIVTRNSQNYVTILCKKDYFTGGAHDLYDYHYLNYDVYDHSLITLASLIKADKLDELRTIAERIFRKNEGLSPTQTLDGYFFDDLKFALPNNFTITTKGLNFFYNYYEIKPFAAGTTELTIPFSSLKDLAVPGSILADQLRK